MRPVIIVVVCIVFSMPVFAADDSVRSSLIGQVEATYLSESVVGSDSPFIDQMLGSARTLNPGADESAWTAIRGEVAAALTQTLLAKGSGFELMLYQSLDSLSNEELKRLSKLLSDPAYKKFQAAMTNKDSQKRLVQALMARSLSMIGVVNGVVEKHGLKTPQ